MKALIVSQLSGVDWKPGRSYLDQKVLHANLPSQKNINLIHRVGNVKKDNFEFQRQGLFRSSPHWGSLAPSPLSLTIEHFFPQCLNEHINFFYYTSSTFLSDNLVVANTDIRSNFLESNQDSSLQSSLDRSQTIEACWLILNTNKTAPSIDASAMIIFS